MGKRKTGKRCSYDYGKKMIQDQTQISMTEGDYRVMIRDDIAACSEKIRFCLAETRRILNVRKLGVLDVVLLHGVITTPSAALQRLKDELRDYNAQIRALKKRL